MAALKLITSRDKPRLSHLIGQWRHALPLPTLLACSRSPPALVSLLAPSGTPEKEHLPTALMVPPSLLSPPLLSACP
eukprot:1811797-Karenia_brevis.AAC.1